MVRRGGGKGKSATSMTSAFEPFFFRTIPQDSDNGIMYLADRPPEVRFEEVGPEYYCVGSRMNGHYDGKMVWHISALGYRDLMPQSAMFDRQIVSEMRPHRNNDIPCPANSTLFTDGISYWSVDNVLIRSQRRTHRTMHRSVYSKMYSRKETPRQRRLSRKKTTIR
jgi:hypothetical protein